MTAGRGPSRVGLRAVIYDMDGVLIDSEPVWRRVEIDVFASVGVALTEADCRETMGLRIDEVVRLRRERQPWSGASDQEVGRRILDGVVEHVRAEGAPIDGALDSIRSARRAGLRCGVASSSPRPLIAAVVDRLGIAGDIDVICSAEDEKRGKPAPDVYLRAASLLGVPAASCLAIEDSVSGVLSARAAGMQCVAIPDPLVASDPRLAAASLRLTSLRELDGALLTLLSASYFA